MKDTLVKLALISSAAFGTLLFAQTPDQTQPPPAQPQQHVVNPQQQLNHLTKKLALTADQQSQILPILTDRQQQVSSINSDTTLTQKERHAKLKAVRSDSEAKLRNVLTDTQRAAYDEMQQEARERAKTRKQSTVSN
jgi:Spy/CpxP family protein refolding chaperone